MSLVGVNPNFFFFGSNEAENGEQSFSKEDRENLVSKYNNLSSTFESSHFKKKLNYKVLL